MRNANDRERIKKTAKLFISIVVTTIIILLLVQGSVFKNWARYHSSNFNFGLISTSVDSEADILKLKILRMHEKIRGGKVQETVGVLKECPKYPNDLKGNFSVQLENPPTIKELEMSHTDFGSVGLFDVGGHFQPTFTYKCKARQKIAILIPFRNRDQHLRVLLHNILPMLKRQRLDFRIYILEQENVLELPRENNESGSAPSNFTVIANSSTMFNKASLYNVGFVEALKRDQYDCFIFQDVDLIPENDQNIYECRDSPWHLSSAIDKFNYSKPYGGSSGGVLAFTTQNFLLVNGYSNAYFNWGAEDDDMYFRMAHRQLTVQRPPAEIGRYKAIPHKQSEIGKDRWKIFDARSTRFDTDGLSNLRYILESVTLNRLFTRIKVSLFKVS